MKRLKVLTSHTVKLFGKSFFVYDHTFGNYFLRSKAAGRRGRVRSMFNSLSSVYSHYYPELDFVVYRSTQTSLRLLFGLDSLDELTRSEALGVGTFLSKTSDSWYVKYGQCGFLSMRATLLVDSFTFSKNGLFHRLLFDEYSIQFRRNSLQRWFTNPEGSSESALDKNPSFFVNTERSADFSVFDFSLGGGFYKTRELFFGTSASELNRESILETYLSGRQRYYEQLGGFGSLDVRFTQAVYDDVPVEVLRSESSVFFNKANNLVMSSSIVCLKQIRSLAVRLLGKLPISLKILEARAIVYRRFYTFFSLGKFLSCFTQRQWRLLIGLNKVFCCAIANRCLVFKGSSFDLNFSSSSTEFIHAFVWKLRFSRKNSLKLGLSGIKIKPNFRTRCYTHVRGAKFFFFSFGGAVSIALQRILVNSVEFKALVFANVDQPKLLRELSRIVRLLTLSEFRLNNLYAFRIVTQLAVGYPGLYLPELKYEQRFVALNFSVRRTLFVNNNVVHPRCNLRSKKFNITSLFFTTNQALSSVGPSIWSFVSCLNAFDVNNFLSFNARHTIGIAVPLAQIFWPMYFGKSRILRNQILPSAVNFAAETCSIKLMPSLRVFLSTNSFLNNSVRLHDTSEVSFYLARFLQVKLNDYHEALAVKIRKSRSSFKFFYEPYGCLSAIETWSRNVTNFAGSIRGEPAATANLSAGLHLNYGRSGILGIFRNAGVANYSQFFGVYFPNELANFSFIRGSLLSEERAARLRGGANYMFFDELSRTFFSSELRDQRSNFAANCLALPHEAALFFVEHSKFGSFSNVFDYYLPLNIAGVDRKIDVFNEESPPFGCGLFFYYKGHRVMSAPLHVRSTFRMLARERALLSGLVTIELCSI